MNVPNLDFHGEENGENIKVCVRVRPLNTNEIGRGDSKSLEANSNTEILFQNKNIKKIYSFNQIFNEENSQDEVFFSCSLNVIKKLLRN